MAKNIEHHNIDTFYLNTINHFDDERRLFQQYIDSVTPNASELHQLDWDSRQRREDIESAKVEQEMVENELAKTDIKWKEAKVLLDDHKLERTSRQKQIDLLSQLSQPVEHDITYVYGDAFPHSTVSSASSSSKFADPAEVKKMVSRRYRTGEIVKLENQLTELNSVIAKNTGALMLRVSELRAATKRIDAGQHEAVKDDYDAAKSVIKDLENIDMNSFSTVKEILKLRLKIMSAQRIEVEENDRLHKDKEYFEQKELEARNQLINDTGVMKKRLDKELAETTKEYKRQLNDLDTQAEELKKVNKVEHKKNEKNNDIENLKIRHNIVKSRYNKLRRRHALEMEGYNNEVKILKKKIKNLYKQIPSERL
jgi:coiled-coil domain-containing protein 77